MLEDGNGDGNEADKGRRGVAYNGNRKTEALREISGSLYRPPSGIRLHFHPSNLCLGAKEREVTDSMS